jgi:tRNA(Arg) A34 adenosine deaminase TadA
MKHKLLLTFSIILILVLAFLILQTQLFRFYPVQVISAGYEKELVRNGAKSLLSEDVPVGAMVIYQDKIIGRGYNTVYRDGNIAGHAEINALNDAVSTIGMETFMELDRSDMVVYSTYEPCEMCKGTLVHYRINQVKFLKDKSLSRWLKNDRAGMIYELSKRQAGSEHIQDSLFLLHPRYPGSE